MEMGASDPGLRPGGPSTGTTPAGSTLARPMAPATIRKGQIRDNRTASTPYAARIS